MKRYKLKKDLPTFRAGDLFELRDDGCLYWVRGWRNPDEVKYYNKEVIAYHKNTLKFFPNILTDWFEEIKESTRWKPEMHQVYRYVNSDGSVYGTTWTDDFFDNGRFEIGSCFQAEEEAEKAVEKLKAWKRLKDKGFRFNNCEIEMSEIAVPKITITAFIDTEQPETLNLVNLLFGGDEEYERVDIHSR